MLKRLEVQTFFPKSNSSQLNGDIATLLPPGGVYNYVLINIATPAYKRLTMSSQNIEVVTASGPRARISRLKMFALAAAVLLIVIAVYVWSGLFASAGEQAATQESSLVSPDDLRALNDAPRIATQLAAKLEKSPNDPDGWALLARTHAKLGEHAKAKAAFQRALALRDTDAGLMADYADTLAFLNNQSFDGEPAQMIERALAIDPKNNAALMLSGLAAFDQQQYAQAIKQWEKVVKSAGPKTPIGMQAQGAIDEARKRSASAQ